MSISTPNRQIPAQPPQTADVWWREPYVWMVIAGPLAVIIACIITWGFIMRAPDALVAEDYYRQGIEINRRLEQAPPPMQPALLGRNHSATGGKRASDQK